MYDPPPNEESCASRVAENKWNAFHTRKSICHDAINTRPTPNGRRSVARRPSLSIPVRPSAVSRTTSRPPVARSAQPSGRRKGSARKGQRISQSVGGACRSPPQVHEPRNGEKRNVGRTAIDRHTTARRPLARCSCPSINWRKDVESARKRRPGCIRLNIKKKSTSKVC